MNLGDLVELHILSMKPHKNCFIKTWISLVSLVCWNILSVGLMYIYMCVFWTYGIMLCFMHVIVDHSMHDERSSSNFTNSFLHWTPNQSYIYIGILDSIGAVSVGDVEGMVLEEFQNIMLSVYIFVDFFFLNGLQKSTDRIFRLECQLCWLPVVTFYKYHILGKHWHKP